MLKEIEKFSGLQLEVSSFLDIFSPLPRGVIERKFVCGDLLEHRPPHEIP